MKKPRMILTIHTVRPTDSWGIGSNIMSIFDAEDRLRPEELCQWESKVADFTGVDDAEKFWSQHAQMSVAGTKSNFLVGLRWRRRELLRYDAEIKHTKRNARGDLIFGSLNLTAQPINDIDWSGLFQKLFLAIDGSYGFLHLIDISKLERGQQPRRVRALASGLLYSGKYPSLPLAFFSPNTLKGVHSDFAKKYSIYETDRGIFYMPAVDWPSIFADGSIVEVYDEFEPKNLPGELFDVKVSD